MFWPAVIFAVTFVGSLALFLAIIVLLPQRYFAEDRRRFLADKPPAMRWLGIAGKNILGVALIGLGALLSLPLMPGQGLLTIVIGLMLLDVPGKHRLARRVVRRRGMLHAINRLRGWFGRPNLVIDE